MHIMRITETNRIPGTTRDYSVEGGNSTSVLTGWRNAGDTTSDSFIESLPEERAPGS